MCGRIGSSMPRAELLETYHWLRDAPEELPRYNIAPTDPVLAIGPDRVEVVRWGIDGARGGLFNLRAETALAKPYYQRLLLQKRILVPASHFYEWRKVGERRLPMAVSRADGGSCTLPAFWRDGRVRPRRPYSPRRPTPISPAFTTGCRWS